VLPVTVGASVRFVRRADVQWVQAQGDYSRLHLGDGGGHRGQLLPVASRHDHLMGDDQVMLAFDGGLNVVADDAAAPTRRRHGAGVRIGQGDLAVR